jgi:uncharacterized protein (DUF2141 family)
MKKVKHLIATASLFTAFISPSLLAAELVVVVDNIKDVQGSLYVSLYNQEASFDSNENAVKRQKVSVDKTTMSVNLGDLPAGEYAVKAYQDVNNSGAMDFNGPMPAEPFGSSSTSKALAPPKYSEAKFTLDKNLQVQVHLLK